jgi:uncharacterized membrane protein YphA (DoxX/SURF4 family)
MMIDRLPTMKKPAMALLIVALIPQVIWCANQLISSTPLDTLVRPFVFTAAFLAVAVTWGRLRLINTGARIVIGGAFLLALWSRFDNFAGFIRYTGIVNSFLPRWTDPVAAVGASVAEVTLCICMLLGIQTRRASLGAGILFFLFATAMTMSGLTQFDWAVYVLSAGGLALSTVNASLLSLDSLLFGKKAADSKSREFVKFSAP